jgi:hypothetical protein
MKDSNDDYDDGDFSPATKMKRKKHSGDSDSYSIEELAAFARRVMTESEEVTKELRQQVARQTESQYTLEVIAAAAIDQSSKNPNHGEYTSPGDMGGRVRGRCSTDVTPSRVRKRSLQSPLATGSPQSPLSVVSSNSAKSIRSKPPKRPKPSPARRTPGKSRKTPANANKSPRIAEDAHLQTSLSLRPIITCMITGADYAWMQMTVNSLEKKVDETSWASAGGVALPIWTEPALMDKLLHWAGQRLLGHPSLKSHYLHWIKEMQLSPLNVWRVFLGGGEKGLMGFVYQFLHARVKRYKLDFNKDLLPWNEAKSGEWMDTILETAQADEAELKSILGHFRDTAQPPRNEISIAYACYKFFFQGCRG